MADDRHVKYRIGPWRGIETNVFDPSFTNKGALRKAEDVIFAPFTDGKGYSTEARVRPGRANWNSDNMYARFYLAEMEAGEATWTNGTASLVYSKFGYGSRAATIGGAGTLDVYRTFTAKDVTQGGQSKLAADHTFTFWMALNDPTRYTKASCLFQFTSDVGPGAPAGWTNQYVATGNQISPDPSAAAPATWVKYTVAVSAMAVAGAPDLTAITGINFRLVCSAAMTASYDEAYLETPKNSQTVGMSEFLSASSGNRYLMVKNGDTLFTDKNASLTMTKVRSALSRNAFAYFAKVYNQCFMADGDTMTVFDGTLNASGAYNWRPMGFTAPSAAGVTPTNVAAGTLSTAGTHKIFISYIYGNGSTVYGQSNIVYVGDITIGVNEQYQVASMPVPAESEGVIKKRIYIGLAAESIYAPAYFAKEVAASVTSTTVDVADTTLSAPTNPLGPRNNDTPPVAKSILPYENSLIYLNLVGNPTGLMWSKQGIDLNSGPEVVPATNIAIAQRGEEWTGGIVRGRVLYCFTRRSIHEARFDQFGNLNVTEVDQSQTGNSVSVGAIAQNAIWADDEANIYFQSEQGICVIDPGGRIRQVSKKTLLDEYKDINDVPSANTFDFRRVDSSDDWNAGTVGANLLVDSGILKYNFPGSRTVAQTNNITEGATEYAGSEMHVYQGIGGDNNADPPLNAYSSNANYLAAGGILYIKCTALTDMVVSGGSLLASKGNNSSQTLQFGVYRHRYEMGRPVQVGDAQVTLPGTGQAVTTASHTGSTDDIKQFDFSVTPVYVPCGEIFWIGITNLSGAVVKPLPTGVVASATVQMELNPTKLGIVTNGTLTWQSGAFGYVPAFRLSLKKVTHSSSQATDTFSAPLVQRYGDFVATLLTGSASHSTRRREVWMETSPDAVTWLDPQMVYADEFINIGSYSGNLAPFPYYQLPDYRPNATDPTYPHKLSRPYVRYTVYLAGDSLRGAQVARETDSLVSITRTTAFTEDFNVGVNYTSEASFASEPYPYDVWTSAAFDLGSTPSEWGRFNLAFALGEQKITLQVRTDSVSNFAGNPTWYTIDANSIPTTADLPINGKYVQARIIFNSDAKQFNGVVSTVDNLLFSYKFSSSVSIAPVAPPAGSYFGRYHLMAYAPKGHRQASDAWCLSPGEKFSHWNNQPVNVFCVYDNKLLAGRAGSGKISQYWNEDYQDDGSGVIQGNITSMPTRLGFDNIKTVMGMVVFAGVKEFKGVPVGNSSIVPTGGVPRRDIFVAGLSSGSKDGPPVMPPLPNFFNTQAGPFDDRALSPFAKESHSTPYRIGVVGGDSFFFDLGRQDDTFEFFWQATSHIIVDAITGKSFKRFPYLTDAQPEFFVENYYGV